MITFRIAQISDLHFGSVLNRLSAFEASESVRKRAALVLKEVVGQPKAALEVTYPSTFNPDIAISLLRTLCKEGEALDAIVVTGDLATTGNDVDLRLACDYFSGALPEGWSPPGGSVPNLLADGGPPLIALPGNHDRYQGRALLPGGGNFERFFGGNWDFRTGATYDVLSPIEDSSVKVCTLEKDGYGLCIILADLSLETQGSGEGDFGWIGQGRAVEEVVSQLVESTLIANREAAEAAIESATIWAVHFPPCFEGIPGALELLRGERLVEAARECGATLILAGHTHESREYAPAHGGGQVRVVCCGATTGISRHGQYSYNVLEIEIAKGGKMPAVKVFEKVWDPSRRRFSSPRFDATA